MKKLLTRFLSFIMTLALTIVVFGNGATGIIAHAASNYCCATHTEKSYINGTDVCAKCGYLRVHKCSLKMPFVLTKANAAVRSAPRESASKRSYCLTKKFYVTGRIRNEYKNLWLQVGNDYIYSENVSFDFDTMAKEASKGITNGGVVLNSLFLNRVNGAVILYKNLMKTYDLKNDKMLGKSSTTYNVYANGKKLSRKYNGEQLGNRLYGYECAKAGFSIDFTIKAPCLAFQNCTDKNDNNDIYSGWKYGKTGQWGDYKW